MKGEHPGGFEYLGYTGGVVATESHMLGFLGATRGTNATAELSAIAYAYLYILQSDISHAVIYYDAKYADNMASAQWSPDTNV